MDKDHLKTSGKMLLKTHRLEGKPLFCIKSQRIPNGSFPSGLRVCAHPACVASGMQRMPRRKRKRAKGRVTKADSVLVSLSI